MIKFQGENIEDSSVPPVTVYFMKNPVILIFSKQLSTGYPVKLEI
jgi:hypothetical protein